MPIVTTPSDKCIITINKEGLPVHVLHIVHGGLYSWFQLSSREFDGEWIDFSDAAKYVSELGLTIHMHDMPVARRQ